MRTPFPVGLRRRRPPLLLMVIGLALGCLLALAPLRPSLAISVASVTNPQQANGTWVTDMANMLSLESEAELNRMIADLEATNGTELAVVTVPDTQPSASPKAFATELFETWGIGKEGVDNGVLFLVSKGDRRTEVETGYGVEGVLGDAKVGSILASRVTPQFKSGNFDAGILAGTEAIVSSLKGEAFEGASSSRGQRVVNNSIAVESADGAVTTGLQVIFGMTSVVCLAILSLRLTKLVSGRFIAVELEPMGRSHVSARSADANLDVKIMSLLIGKQMAEQKGLIYKRSAMLSHYDDPVVEESWLVTSHQRSQLVGKSWMILGWFLALAGTAGLLLRDGIVIAPIFTFVWLCCELWFYKQDLCFRESLSINATTAAAIRIAIISTVGAVGALIVNDFLGGWIAWPMLAAFFGFCAVMLRLARSLPDQPKAICEVCHNPMQRLSTEELSHHTSKPEKTEIQLQSKLYEGWRCNICAVQAEDDDLKIHLASHILNQKSYSLCTACDALTLEIASKTHQKPTLTKRGKRTVMRLCHCCNGHSKKKFTIPKIEPKPIASSSHSHSSHRSSSSSSTSSSSSYSSPSASSSSSSSSSSSGSFGGGSSGGGGAGSSW